MQFPEANSGMQSGESQEIEIRTAHSLPEIEARRESRMAWLSHGDSDIDSYLSLANSGADPMARVAAPPEASS
jgi:hypothetical protein